MADKRIKVCSQEIEGSTISLNIYGEPDEHGIQHVTSKVTYDVTKLPEPMQLTLAAVGYGRICENRYNRQSGGVDVAAVAVKLWDELAAGEWTPGRMAAAGESEPSDLELAVAEVTGQPIHLVQHQFAETTQYYDAHGQVVPSTSPSAERQKLTQAGKALRFFNKDMQTRLSVDPRIAAVLARLERERAQKRIAEARKTSAAPLVDDLFGGKPAAEQAA